MGGSMMIGEKARNLGEWWRQKNKENWKFVTEGRKKYNKSRILGWNNIVKYSKNQRKDRSGVEYWVKQKISKSKVKMPQAGHSQSFVPN